MKDDAKTQAQLIAELAESRRRVAELEVSEAKRAEAEEALRASEEQFRRVFDDSAAGMILRDPRGRFLRVNQTLCDLLGYSEDELLHLKTSDITLKGDPNEDSHIAGQLSAGDTDSCALEKR